MSYAYSGCLHRTPLPLRQQNRSQYSGNSSEFAPLDWTQWPIFEIDMLGKPASCYDQAPTNPIRQTFANWKRVQPDSRANRPARDNIPTITGDSIRKMAVFELDVLRDEDWFGVEDGDGYLLEGTTAANTEAFEMNCEPGNPEVGSVPGLTDQDPMDL